MGWGAAAMGYGRSDVEASARAPATVSGLDLDSGDSLIL